MRHFRKTVYVLALLGAVIAVSHQAGAISIREMLGLEDKEKEKEAQPADAGGAAQNWAVQDAGKQPLVMNYADIQKVVANLSARQKENLLDDPEKFKQMVHQEANNMSMLSAARANKIDTDANTQFLMRRSAENVLREAYLAKLIASKLPADFPTEQQVRDYFDKNESSFFLGERVHVWQIFLKTDAGLSDAQVAAIEQRLKTLRRELLDDKIDFADAAMQYSQHPASRSMGGYMGLVKVAELKPELSKPLLALPEGELSEPLRSDTGWHILKRGNVVPKQEVSFDQVKTQIHDLLLKQARNQLRQAVYDQAAKTYPVELQDATLEEWRLKLTGKQR
jgi:parvulin-like peptidyl-prolyl isomerase